MIAWPAAALFSVLLAASPAAVDAPLEDPAAEARAQALMQEIRCVACENEPISQSASDIARDMRRAVRTQIAAGASDGDVRDWFAERYGEFVLFRPSAQGSGVVLWAFPFLLLLGVGALLVRGAVKARRRFRGDHASRADS